MGTDLRQFEGPVMVNPGSDHMARYLIVANQTIGEQLTAQLDELASAGSCAFRFLVPVTDSEGTQQWDSPPDRPAHPRRAPDRRGAGRGPAGA